MDEFVVYQPDKASGFGQALRKRALRPAFESLQRFLRRCTNAQGFERLKLVAWRPTEFDDDLVIEPVIQRTIDHFGAPDREEPLGSRWPSGEPLKGGALEWDLDPDEVDAAVEYLSSAGPWPKSALGPVELNFEVSFQWIDPDTRELLANQEPGKSAKGETAMRSSLLVSLGRRQFVQPELWFPFPEGSPALNDYLRRIEHHIPFAIHERHFRVAIPGKRSGEYYLRKLVLPPSAV